MRNSLGLAEVLTARRMNFCRDRKNGHRSKVGWKFSSESLFFPEIIRWGLRMGKEAVVTTRMGFLGETGGKPCSGMAKSTGVMREIG